MTKKEKLLKKEFNKIGTILSGLSQDDSDLFTPRQKDHLLYAAVQLLRASDKSFHLEGLGPKKIDELYSICQSCSSV